jgi:ribosomal protein S17
MSCIGYYILSGAVCQQKNQKKWQIRIDKRQKANEYAKAQIRLPKV